MRPILVGLFSLTIVCAVACDGTETNGPDAGDSGVSWTPGHSVSTKRAPNARGYLDRKGLIHAHSAYSHDACDGEPVKDGVRDPLCIDDFRNAVCDAFIDFAFLTDHPDGFGEHEFPDVLLYDASRGDVLIERGDRGPVANRAACEDSVFTTLVMAGAETLNLMPVGLEGHPVPFDERGDVYGTRNEANIATIHAQGGLALCAHSENQTVDDLIGSGLDGFEMYNLHRNMVSKGTEALDLALRIAEKDPGLPVPDLSMIRIIDLDDEYLSKWAQVLASGAQRTTTIGTDCHQNTFPGKMADGERIDSYRRMMALMSNHLLVKPESDGSYDDSHLKDALRNHRLFGVFDMWGSPSGFDFYVAFDDEVREIGARVALSSSPVLHIKRPVVDAMERDVKAPDIRVLLLRAESDGSWTEVASSDDGDVAHTVTTAGAHRAEVRITPHHLDAHLGADDYWATSRDHAWVISNAIMID